MPQLIRGKEAFKNKSEINRGYSGRHNLEPIVKDSEMGVNAEEGIITLTGFAGSYAKKWEAENEVKNVAGVKAVI